MSMTIMCMPYTEGIAMVKGSVIVKCADCGIDIVLSPASFSILEQDPTVITKCTRHALAADCVELIVTEATRQEASKYLHIDITNQDIADMIERIVSNANKKDDNANTQH